MDPEHTFLRVHARVSGTLSQLLGLRVRLMLEYACLAAAGALFCLLVIMHTNFVQQVGRWSPGCSREFSGLEFIEAQVVQIKVVVFGLRVRLKRRDCPFRREFCLRFPRVRK
ncbi:hypothetical protein BHM03_00053046 [Ensete ventricosum]|nr:hypothetical protein BHM03_00053046 [Ensete ventricosum]